MDRRQVLAGLAATLTLGSGCLGIFDSDSDSTEGDSPADTTGESSPTATATPLSSGPRAETGQPPTARTATRTPSHATPSAETPAESVLIDPTNLATYTSDTASYSIKYPANWRITTPNQGTVRFTAPASPARMLVRVKHGVPNTVPRETIITTAIRQARRTYSLDQVTRVGKKEVTLPNGIPATVVNLRVSRSSSDMLLWGPFLVAHVADTVYVVGILVPERAHTPSVKRAMHTIVTSLTIQGAPSARRDDTDQVS